VSRVGFALDFIELRQAEAPDVADIFGQKQKMTKAAKLARVCEWVGVGAGIVVGLSGVTVSARLVGALGAGTYGATKFGEYLTKQIPPSTNALANMWGPTDTVMLAPGQGISWKVYASKMQGAKSIGPKSLSLPGTEPGAPPVLPAPVPKFSSENSEVMKVLAVLF
jgi:hypothetical protein